MILFVFLLFLSLQNIYFYNIGLAPFPILSLSIIFIFFFINNKSLKKRDYVYIVILYTFIFFSAIVNSWRPIGNNTLFTIIGYLSGPLFLLLSINFLRLFSINNLYKTLSYILIFHLFFFYTQLIFYYLFNTELNFLYSITGEESRNFDGLRFRPSGIINEPMVYSNIILIFLYFRYTLSNKFEIIDYLALISMQLSFSLFGMLASVVIFLFYKINLFRVLLSICLVMIIFYQFEELIILDRLINILDDGSFQGRYLLTFNSIVSDSSILFFGTGFFYDVPNQDIKGLSLFLQIITIFGLPISLLFIFPFFLKKRSYILSIIFILFFLISDLRFQQYLTWFYFSLLLNFNSFYVTKIYSKV